MVTTQVAERDFIRRTVWLSILVFAISVLVWLIIFVLVQNAAAGSEGEALWRNSHLPLWLTEKGVL